MGISYDEELTHVAKVPVCINGYYYARRTREYQFEGGLQECIRLLQDFDRDQNFASGPKCVCKEILYIH